MLTEMLDYNVAVKIIVQSASCALGAILAKCKQLGGLPFEVPVFVKLYDSLVWPVLDYSASIWGSKTFSAVNSFHNRVCRYFLGVEKYTPNAAVHGDFGIPLPVECQWVSVMI